MVAYAVVSAVLQQVLSPVVHAWVGDTHLEAPFFGAGFVIALAGVLISILGLVWAGVAHRLVLNWNRVDLPLSERQRRHARRQLRGREPWSGSELPVLLALARQHRRTIVGGVPVFAGIAVSAIGMAVALPDWRILLLMGIAAGVLIVVEVQQLFITLPAATRFLAAAQPT